MYDFKDAIQNLEFPEGWSFKVNNGRANFMYQGSIIFGAEIPKSVLNADSKNAFAAFHSFVKKQVKKFSRELYLDTRGKYYVGRYKPGFDVKTPTHPDFVDLNTLLPHGFEWVVTDTLTSDLVMYHNGEVVFKHRIFDSMLDRVAGLGIIVKCLTPKSIVMTANYMVKNLDSHLNKVQEKEDAKARVASWNMR